MQAKEVMESIDGYVVEQRRKFHRIPEVSLKEEKTSLAIRDELESLGIPCEVVGDYGVVARVEGAMPGRKIALRADIDALPMEEETALPFRSTHAGVMHSCGHDGHIAILLATGKLLAARRDSLHGTVLLCFQQAEEIGQGQAPILEYLRKEGGVEAVLGAHLWADIPIGKISLRSGPVMAGTTSFKIKIEGQGCHGSRPDQGLDPINAGVTLIGDTLRLKDREINPTSSTTMSFGLFHAGTATNIIPAEAELGGTLRFFSEEDRQHLISILERGCAAVATLTKCKITPSYGVVLPPVVNHEDCVKEAKRAAARVFGESNIFEFDRIMASDNFGYFLQEYCGLYAFIGIGNKEKGACHAHHNPKFMMDEDALKMAVAYFVEYLNDFFKGES